MEEYKDLQVGDIFVFSTAEERVDAITSLSVEDFERVDFNYDFDNLYAFEVVR